MSSIPPPDPVVKKANEVMDHLKQFVDDHIPTLEAAGHKLAGELKAKGDALLASLENLLGL